ncbi:hypothetical protein EV646_11436 [Kribbella antiqua]|uniref:AbiEi antitoxin N-terminal domain-containing protein n=1 Tax=Kribbella antiqua TaxID=2512217 RepID=A0A4R2ICC8_9ACTN|nr:type IV toxin-antitoxin system AbiEi family antitoxin domain-containing protein [Kribbella antiqua]TCO42213.1 hypothetical protein EV646_11436 [Kribbella antiqua]
MFFDGNPFTRSDAAAAGWSVNKITALLRDGYIRRLVRGVYVDALAADSIELRAAAIARVAPPGAVICRRTAAWLYGIDTLALHEHRDLPSVECVRPPRRRATRLPLSAGHSQTLLHGDVVELGDLSVTSPLATAVHLGRHLDRPFALSAIDSMLHAGLIGHDKLRAAVERYKRHPGIAQAPELVDLAEPLTESPGESWLRLRVIDAGFPRPEVQVAVSTRQRERRIDVAFRGACPDGRRLGLEYDSDRWHSDDRADTRDSARRDELEEVGWLILPVRRGDVLGRNPALELAIGEALGIQPRLPRRW